LLLSFTRQQSGSDYRTLLYTILYASLLSVIAASIRRGRALIAITQGGVLLAAAPAFSAGLTILRLDHLDPLKNTFSHCFHFLLDRLALFGGTMFFDVVIVLLAGSILFFLGKSAAFRTQERLQAGKRAVASQSIVDIHPDLVIQEEMKCIAIGVRQVLRKPG
jgi:hypothetical protein